MEGLLQGYRETRRGLARAQRRAEKKADRNLISGMISDCTYVIDWLSTGRQPGARRGVDRRAAYQREIAVDPVRFNSRPAPSAPRRMETNDYNRLIQVMAILSHREHQCFEMHFVGLWSEHEIAEQLGITRDSVHEYIDRAQKKIKNFISKPIQLELELVF